MDYVFILFQLTRSDKIGSAILSHHHRIHILAIRITLSRLAVFVMAVAIIRCVPNHRLRRLALTNITTNNTTIILLLLTIIIIISDPSIMTCSGKFNC